MMKISEASIAVLETNSILKFINTHAKSYMTHSMIISWDIGNS